MTFSRSSLGGAAFLTALLLGAPGEARTQSLSAVARPAYCAPLAWVIRTWRDTRPGDSVQVRSHALARRLDRVAQVAAATGRADVAKALDLSARWVSAGDGPNHAARARDLRLGERMMAVGRGANPTIRQDCGFTVYPKKSV